MNYAKVRTVRSPQRGTKLSAGIDFFVPQRITKESDVHGQINHDEFDSKFLSDLIEKNPHLAEVGRISENDILIAPQESVMIPSGIHVNLEQVLDVAWEGECPSGPINIARSREMFGAPLGLMLTAHNKSGVGTKKRFDRLAEVVDEDYQGELHISVINAGNEIQRINPGDKLIQFILEPILLSMPNEVEFDSLYTNDSERGQGGFGSTGA